MQFCFLFLLVIRVSITYLTFMDLVTAALISTEKHTKVNDNPSYITILKVLKFDYSSLTFSHPILSVCVLQKSLKFDLLVMQLWSVND